jgi:hypothetical protein
LCHPDADPNGHSEHTNANPNGHSEHTDANAGDTNADGDPDDTNANSGHPDAKSDRDSKRDSVSNCIALGHSIPISIPNGIALVDTAGYAGDQPVDPDARGYWG